MFQKRCCICVGELLYKIARSCVRSYLDWDIQYLYNERFIKKIDFIEFSRPPLPPYNAISIFSRISGVCQMKLRKSLKTLRFQS